MSGFDRGQFDADLDDIEAYLGYLQGNYNMWETFHNHQLSTLDIPPWPVEWKYETPCPEGRFKVDFDYYPMIDVVINEGEAGMEQQRAAELKQAMDEAYSSGRAWAGGSAGQLRQICEQFTEPFVPTLQSAIHTMQSRVVNKLQLDANDDWAQLGGQTSQWSGEFATDYNIFYTNYNDVIARFGTFAGWINVVFASGTTIIAATQLGAAKFVTSMKRNLESQLDHWVAAHGDKPTDPGEWPAWVGDVGAVTQRVLGLASDVPVVGEVTKFVDLGQQVYGLMGDIDRLLGGDGLAKLEEYADVMTGTEAWELVSNTLYDDHYRVYTEAMDQLNSGKTGAAGEQGLSGSLVLEQMRDTQARGDWGLPDVRPENMIA